MIKTDKRKEGQ